MKNNQVPERNNESGSKAGMIQRWAFQAGNRESRPVAILRCWLRIIFIMFHEFTATAISLRASALTYTIVLSMVPMLAMSTALLKGMGRDNELRIAAYKFLDQLEPEQQEAKKHAMDSLANPVPDSFTSDTTTSIDISSGENGTGSTNTESLTTHLRSAIDKIFDYVDRTNFAAIGAFGLVGLLLTVVLVLSTIENAMNAIWHSKKGRSIFRKIMDYLALLILLPVSINIALAGDAVLESPTIMAYLHTVIPSAWAVKMLLKFLPFAFVILSLMIMYLFFPTVHVKTYAALSGAIFAGFFWFLVQKIYIVMQVGVAKHNAIYGSFATVPLFLIWVHLGWTFILLGASLAYAVQNRNQYHLPGAGGSPQRNLQLAFDIANLVYENFEEKKPTPFEELVRLNPGIQTGDIRNITDKLFRGGILHRIEDNNRAFVPTSPSTAIEAREIVRIILGHETIPTIGGEFAQTVITAAETAIPNEAFPVHVKPPAKIEQADIEKINDNNTVPENDEKAL